MIEVQENVFVGTQDECGRTPREFAVVHACKSRCHQAAVGYRGSLPASHPNYLFLEQGQDLYLNLIDPPAPLFKVESFIVFLNFADRAIKTSTPIFIHCNQGLSRAPSLALLALARISESIASDSFATAAAEFQRRYPQYAPGTGIVTFMSTKWPELLPPAA